MIRRALLTAIVLPLMLLCTVLTACEKLELPTDQDKEGTGKDEGNDTGGDDGGTDVGSVLRVSELKSAAVPAGEDVWVKGYIVGYVPKNKTLSGTVFSADNAVETNIVLADAPDVTTHADCAPMQLKQNTDPRLDLNLAAYPENLGQLVYLYGTKDTYYKGIGLKPVTDYSWEHPYGEGGDDEDTDPDAPTDGAAGDPVIDYEAPATVMEGD